MSYPIYILDDNQIVFPANKEDLNHCDFWESTVARIVAKRFHLPLEELLNLPYCQRRARINEGVVYYGEKPEKKLLRLIEKAVGEKLRFAFDDHERRSPFDLADFKALSQQ